MLGHSGGLRSGLRGGRVSSALAPHPRGPRRPTQRRSRPAPPVAPARSLLGRDVALRLRTLWSVVAGRGGGAAGAHVRARGRARGSVLSILGMLSPGVCRAVRLGTGSWKIQPGPSPAPSCPLQVDPRSLLKVPRHVPGRGWMERLRGCGSHSLLSSTPVDSLLPTHRGLSHYRPTLPHQSFPGTSYLATGASLRATWT